MEIRGPVCVVTDHDLALMNALMRAFNEVRPPANATYT